MRNLPESNSSFLEAVPSPKPSISTSLSGAFSALRVTSATNKQNAGVQYQASRSGPPTAQLRATERNTTDQLWWLPATMWALHILRWQKERKKKKTTKPLNIHYTCKHFILKLNVKTDRKWNVKKWIGAKWKRRNLLVTGTVRGRVIKKEWVGNN